MADDIPPNQLPSSEALGLKLLQSVREMQAGQVARVVESKELIQVTQASLESAASRQKTIEREGESRV